MNPSERLLQSKNNDDEFEFANGDNEGFEDISYNNINNNNEFINDNNEIINVDDI